MITSSSTGTIYKVFEIKKHPFLLIPSHLNSFPIGYRIKRVYAPEGGKDESPWFNRYSRVCGRKYSGQDHRSDPSPGWGKAHRYQKKGGALWSNKEAQSPWGSRHRGICGDGAFCPFTFDRGKGQRCLSTWASKGSRLLKQLTPYCREPLLGAFWDDERGQSIRNRWCFGHNRAPLWARSQNKGWWGSHRKEDRRTRGTPHKGWLRRSHSLQRRASCLP